MVNDIVNAVTDAMASEFTESDGYEIYTDEVPEGFEPKSFLVNSTSPSWDKKNSTTYEYDDLITIQYNPQYGQEEINDVVARLADCLEVIEISHDGSTTKARTEQTNIAVYDGILTYIIRVPYIYYKYPDGDLMDNVEIGVSHG